MNVKEKIERYNLSKAIRGLLDAAGANRITITLDAQDARVFVQDLDWATKTSLREYKAEVRGDVLPEEKTLPSITE